MGGLTATIGGCSEPVFNLRKAGSPLVAGRMSTVDAYRIAVAAGCSV